MSDSSEKSELVARVIDAIYGNMFIRPPKFPKEMPEELKQKFLERTKNSRVHHKELIRKLYEKHMSTAQLKELLHFHTSDMGKSIKDAQSRIHKELAEISKEMENKTGNSEIQHVKTVTYTYKLDDES